MRTACRLATAGQPIERVASALQAGLPTQGEAAAGAVRIASLTGGRTAAVFESLAVMAREETELAGERAAAAAQARLSAAIVAGIPVAILAVTGLSGRLGELVSGGPAGMVMVALGVGLLATGSAWVIGLVAKAGGVRPVSALIVGALAGLALRPRVARWQPWAGVVTAAVINPVAGAVAAVAIFGIELMEAPGGSNPAPAGPSSRSRPAGAGAPGWPQRRTPHSGGAAAVSGRGRRGGRRHHRARAPSSQT